tara:strand:+ start:816 stop:1058 length:243 start_codon:yes stop_codon:yes gene_type:complete
MNITHINAYEELKKIGAPVIEGGWNGENTFLISAEDNIDDRIWADYWNGYFMDKEVEEILYKHNLYAEWVNPGVLGVYTL